MKPFADSGEGGWGAVLPWLSAPLLITAAVLVLVLALIVALLVWRVYRRVRRSPAWDRGMAAIRARATRPGPARDVARLRRDLLMEVDAADVVLSRSKSGRLFTADAQALVDELRINAAAVDVDLRSIERYADPARQRSSLATIRPQVDGLIATSYLARQILLETEATDRARRLTDLREQVERQAAGLEIYRQDTHELDIGDHHA